MKKKHKIWGIGVLAALALTVSACGAEENNSQAEMEQRPLDVEVLLPEDVDPEQEETIATHVTQEDEDVEDANEVEFEIWVDGEKSGSDFIEAEHTGDGVYEITYTFPEDGLYHVQPHVTARGMHSMPVAELEVGDVVEREEES
ncbi:FixH family protein [Texcoconibacillus texcoconensis]|uniref:YtkA-like domain-containing protein n=1 Tax=Texcoconibacillus texcoconensis TaxID=1095777 RepID=A0A840QTK1_9BACI|nr:FixH family protein [Texcoconibacillus texcoconensis]MBB5174643.1 hypothetical protein [Texcoconibacillus texcoconensis]